MSLVPLVHGRRIGKGTLALISAFSDLHFHSFPFLLLYFDYFLTCDAGYVMSLVPLVHDRRIRKGTLEHNITYTVHCMRR